MLGLDDDHCGVLLKASSNLCKNVKLMIYLVHNNSVLSEREREMADLLGDQAVSQVVSGEE